MQRAREQARAPERAPERELDLRLRCVACARNLVREHSVSCAQCLAAHHPRCMRRRGGCATPGCGHAQVVDARRPRPWGRVADVLAGVALVVSATVATGVGLSLLATSPERAEPAPLTAPLTLAPTAPQRVLYLEGAPRWHARYVQQVVAEEPDVLLDTAFLEGGDPTLAPEASLPGNRALDGVPVDLSGYDVLILGDVALHDLGAAWVELLQAEVSERGLGLVVVPGPAHPRDPLQDALAPLLPVELGPAPSAGEARLHLTREGARAPSLRLKATHAENRRAWDALPELGWHAGAAQARPGSTVWLEATAADGVRAPVLALAPTGAGRVAWVGFDEAWRWTPRADTEDDPHARYVLSLLRSVRAERVRREPDGELARRADAILSAAQAAFRRGEHGAAVVSVDEVRARYPVALEGDRARRLRSLVSRIEQVDAGRPLLETPAPRCDDRDGLRALLVALEDADAAHPLRREALRRAELADAEFRRLRTPSEADRDLAAGLRLLDTALNSRAVPLREAEVALLQALASPTCTRGHLAHLRVHASRAAAGVLLEAEHHLRREDPGALALCLDRVSALLRWLPDDDQRPWAEGLHTALRAALAERVEHELVHGHEVLDGALAPGPESRVYAEHALLRFARVRELTPRTAAARIQSAVDAAEARAGSLERARAWLADAPRAHEAEASLEARLALLATWLPPGPRQAEAYALHALAAARLRHWRQGRLERLGLR